jgi:hypothetical protein
MVSDTEYCYVSIDGQVRAMSVSSVLINVDSTRTVQSSSGFGPDPLKPDALDVGGDTEHQFMTKGFMCSTA